MNENPEEYQLDQWKRRLVELLVDGEPKCFHSFISKFVNVFNMLQYVTIKTSCLYYKGVLSKTTSLTSIVKYDNP